MSSFSIHGKMLGLSIVPVLLLGVALALRSASPGEATPAMIAVEHDEPLALQLGLSMRGRARLIDIQQSGTRDILLGVPAGWRRSEVRGADLRAVTAEAPSFGFTRWRLPPGASVSFRTSGSWRQITVQNPQHRPLTVRLTTVDLDSDHAEHFVFLVKDEPVTVP